MALLIVISNMYCYMGAQQCLDVGSYYSHGRYPNTPGKEGNSLCRHCLARQSFHAWL